MKNLHLDNQEKIKISAYTSDENRANKLLEETTPDWDTTLFVIDTARKYSSFEKRRILVNVLDKVTLTDWQKSIIKDIMTWDTGIQVQEILKRYV